VQDDVEENLGATECECGNVEVQWKNTKKCVFDAVVCTVGKVDRKARKPWISL
jgi:hypothetical protein